MKQIKKDFIHYVSLNILGMIGISCYILADTFFIAQALKADGLAALNFSIAFFSLMQGTGLMIGIGGATDFSLQHKNKNKSFMHALYLTGICAVLFLTIGLFFSNPLAQFLGADASTLTLTSTYLKTFLSFSPFFLLNNLLLSFVRNDHNPKLATCAMLISSFMNIILDYIFMFPLQWGIFGAAFATGLSPVISCTILSLHFIKKKNTFHFERVPFQISYFIRICKLGFSSFIGEFASAVALFTFNWLILGISGNIGVAAYGIIANIALIATAIFTGIAQGLQPLASRSIGNNEYDKALYIRKFALITSIIISGIIYLSVAVFSTEIVQLFNSENDLQLASLAKHGVYLYFIGYFFAGLNIVSIAFSSATGNTKTAIMIALSRSCFVLIPIVILLSNVLQMNGIWLSFPVTECLVLLASVLINKRA